MTTNNNRTTSAPTPSRNVQSVITQAQKIIKQAQDAVKSSKKLREKWAKELSDAETQNIKNQARIDKEILKLVQKMDEDTLQFIQKAT